LLAGPGWKSTARRKKFEGKWGIYIPFKEKDKREKSRSLEKENARQKSHEVFLKASKKTRQKVPGPLSSTKGGTEKVQRLNNRGKGCRKESSKRLPKVRPETK